MPEFHPTLIPRRQRLREVRDCLSGAQVPPRRFFALYLGLVTVIDLVAVGVQLTGYTAYNEYITDVIISVIVYLSAFSLVIQMMLPKWKKKGGPNANAEPAAKTAPKAETEKGDKEA